MKKGCLIPVIIVLGLFLYGALRSAWHSNDPGAAEFKQAAAFATAYKDAEGSGNTEQATAMAKKISMTLKATSSLIVGGDDKAMQKLDDGHFLTYCHINGDTVGVVVRVPELKQFTEEAKEAMAQAIWITTTTIAALERPQTQRLGMAVKGVVKYSAVYSGSINTKDPVSAIEARHSVVDTEELFPYFLPAAAEPAAATKPAETSAETKTEG